jgi:hypothetical protein
MQRTIRYELAAGYTVKITLLTSIIFIFETTISPLIVCKQSATENYTM